MDPRNFFSPPPTPKPRLDRHQFGGVVAGPVRRNQTFFMAPYEGVHETRGSCASEELPRIGDRLTVVPDVIKQIKRDPIDAGASEKGAVNRPARPSKYASSAAQSGPSVGSPNVGAFCTTTP
jgi:hypothetical protein